VGALQDAWAQYNRIRTNMDRSELQRYEEHTLKQKALLDIQLEKSRISQEQYNARVSLLDTRLDAKRRDLARKAAKRERANALLGAIVNTAKGVTLMLGSAMPPTNFILAALVGVLGALEIGTILSTPLPQYRKGRYPVIGQDDGKTYYGKVVRNRETGLAGQPEILVGEKPEIIIDPATTRNLQMNYPGIIEAIYNARVPQYYSGNYPGQNVNDRNTETRIPSEYYDLMLH